MRSLLKDAAEALLRALRSGTYAAEETRKATTAGHAEAAAYPGDFHGIPDLAYSPKPDGRPDPGEVVWAWVPFEEDHTLGKDRPVLLVGRDGPWLLGLPLTSKDHDRDTAQEAAEGRLWADIGSGPWDRRGRPSEVRVNRVVRIDPEKVRREGSVLDKERFLDIAAAVRSAR
jgi:hypothetical protein